MRALARRYDIRVYEFANAKNHLHLLVRARRRDCFQAFLRAFAGMVARLVTGARRGHPVGRFWDELAYSRVVQWGREFFEVRRYVIKNEDEARGLVRYTMRARRPSPTRPERGPPDDGRL